MIPGVPQMGGMELLIILAIIMLFFGAKRVPELGSSLGKSMREFRKGALEDEVHETRQQEELFSHEESTHAVDVASQKGHSEEVYAEQRAAQEL
jgi:sec-independent protein translocase protein TatA